MQLSESIYPINFFALATDCFPFKQEQKFALAALPSTCALSNEEQFAKVSLGWHDDGIAIEIKIDQPFRQSIYPAVEEGDSVELFFDTRDIKNSGYNTQFCHHFFFLAKSVDGVSKGEKTHFRTEDRHPICNPELLECHVEFGKNNFAMKIFIPADCLHGYDPSQFNRLGFTYRINRFAGLPQHFSVSSKDYQIEQQPSLWATLNLIKR
jgi:hypothetical protein